MTREIAPAGSARAAAEALLQLCDVDALLQELAEPDATRRLRRLGHEIQGAARLAALRARLAGAVDVRWLALYDRARSRYGRGLAAVRDRVCTGCCVTLPSTARRPAGDEYGVLTCQGCGRLLFWG